MKFADDTKVFGVVNNDADHARLQNDLDTLSEWAAKWQMEYNVGKCKVMHLRHTNPGLDYLMSSQVIHGVDSEKDLGIIVTGDGKVVGQCAEAYMLRLIKCWVW